MTLLYESMKMHGCWNTQDIEKLKIVQDHALITNNGGILPVKILMQTLTSLDIKKVIYNNKNYDFILLDFKKNFHREPSKFSKW